MLGLSPIHLVLVLLVIVLLFGAGRVSGMMGEFGKGIKSFKAGLKDDDHAAAAAPAADAAEPARRITDERPIEHPVTPPTATAAPTASAVTPPSAPRASEPERR